MPPKSKNKEKAAKKIVEDKTFGMKNKNRSAKIQNQMAQMQAMYAQAGSKAEKAKREELQQKKSAKEAKAAYEAEMALLHRTLKDDKKDDPNLGVDEDDYRWTAEDFDAVEAEGLLEEELDKEREALKDRTDLTPVNEDTFKAWWSQNQAEKKKKEEERLKQVKISGKGRGRDLWNVDATLFVDDDEAIEEFEREEEEGEEGAEGAAAPAKKAE